MMQAFSEMLKFKFKAGFSSPFFAPPPLPSSRRGPPKMRRGCTASAGVPGSSWRPFPEHSSLPPPSTQRPPAALHTAAYRRELPPRRRQNERKYFPAPRATLGDRRGSNGSRPPKGGGIYLFFQSALTGTPHCTPPCTQLAG